MAVERTAVMMHPVTNGALQILADSLSHIEQSISVNQMMELLIQIVPSSTLSFREFRARVETVKPWTRSSGRPKKWEYRCKACRDRGWVKSNHVRVDCPECEPYPWQAQLQDWREKFAKWVEGEDANS